MREKTGSAHQKRGILLIAMHQIEPLSGARSKGRLAWWALEVSKLSLYL